jgi:hypothetical protein
VIPCMRTAGGETGAVLVAKGALRQDLPLVCSGRCVIAGFAAVSDKLHRVLDPQHKGRKQAGNAPPQGGAAVEEFPFDLSQAGDCRKCYIQSCRDVLRAIDSFSRRSRANLF